MAADETPSIPDEDLPDHEVDWEERLRREVVRNYRHRWHRLHQMMEESRHRSPDPEAAPSEPSAMGAAPTEGETDPPGRRDAEVEGA
jgi:hypothetical protein